MSSLSFSHAVQSLLHATDVTLFALVDGLQYERFTGEELIFKRDIAVPLFDTWPDSRIAFAGPWIIHMNEAMDTREKLCEVEEALPSVSWIVTSTSLDKLIAHLKKYINIEMPSGEIALLRFYDPRVQLRLGKLLNDDQHDELTSTITEWCTTIKGKIYSFKCRS